MTRPTEPFFWGTATSAFQIEGSVRDGGRGPSIWDVFCQTPGRTANGATGEPACDHLRRYREDVGLMRALNLNAYRFSVSWSRVQPAGRGNVNGPGLDFYDRLVDALLEAGITPWVTLYHWDLPAALQDELGGWENADTPRLFADYATIMYERLGDRVRHWMTINEPWVVVDGGYLTGVHAPGVCDRVRGYRVGHELLRAHALAVAAYRAGRHGDGVISLALNSSFSFPKSESQADAAASERALLDFAGWFGDPAWFGDYPAELLEAYGDLLPAFSAEDRQLLARSMDYLAINYYTSDVVRHADNHNALHYERQPFPLRPVTATDWPIVPEGLHRLLVWLHRRYGELPVYITENGVALPDRVRADGTVHDPERIAYLREHFSAARRAMADGVDLRGYFVWSLLDNLEWSSGYDKRFGLVRCDFETQRRTIKDSGRWYAEWIARGGWEQAKADAMLAPEAAGERG
jgi:beta-galactosidase